MCLPSDLGLLPSAWRKGEEEREEREWQGRGDIGFFLKPRNPGCWVGYFGGEEAGRRMGSPSHCDREFSCMGGGVFLRKEMKGPDEFS